MKSNPAGSTVCSSPLMRLVSDGAARCARRQYTTRKEEIIRELGRDKATTRMLAVKLGCQSSDLTRPMLELRTRKILREAYVGPDPVSRCKARYWALVDPVVAEMVDAAT